MSGCGAHGLLGVTVASGLGLLITALLALAFAWGARGRDPAGRWARWFSLNLGAGALTLALVALLLATALSCSPALTWSLPLAGPLVGWVVAARGLRRARGVS